jgi:hypothetical protein
MIEITLSKENYKVLHQLIGDQLDVIFAPYDDVPDYQLTEEQQKIIDAVTLFSSYQVTYNL